VFLYQSTAISDEDKSEKSPLGQPNDAFRVTVDSELKILASIFCKNAGL
jgi:hypothetical protein